MRMKASATDRILEGAAAMLMLASLSLIIIHWSRLPANSQNDLIMLACITPINYAIFFASAYAPVKWINFPVRPTEQNIGVQYWLVGKTLRILNIIVNLLLLFICCKEISPAWEINPGIFEVLMAIQGILIAVAFIIYYIFAFKYQ